MRRDCTASSSAASSTIGPRDVLIRIAPGFIRARSAAPISPRERGDSTRWMLIASEPDKSSSFETKLRPRLALGLPSGFRSTRGLPFSVLGSNWPCTTRDAQVQRSRWFFLPS